MTLAVYAPAAAKPMLQSTSAVYTLDVPRGDVLLLDVMFDDVAHVSARKADGGETHLRYEE